MTDLETLSALSLRPGLYYDLDGQPTDLDGWVQAAETLGDRRRVAASLIGRSYEVSTIWLGVADSHSLVFGGPPLLYETIAFRRDRRHRRNILVSPLRWPDRQTALRGHQMVVGWVRGRAVPIRPREDW